MSIDDVIGRPISGINFFVLLTEHESVRNNNIVSHVSVSSGDELDDDDDLDINDVEL